MNCIVCDKELTGKQEKYCSIRCSKLGQHRRSRGQAEGIRPKRSHLEMNDSDIQNRINTKSDRIVYLGGYVNDNSNIYVQCKDCGSIYAKTTRCLRPSGHKNIQCDYCLQILRNMRLRAEEQARQQRALELLNRKKEKEAEYIKAHNKKCLKCGKPFVADRLNSRYCSKECRLRMNDSIKEMKRRIVYKDAQADNISLEVLYDRDDGKCWLCGKQTDWNDCETRQDGTFVVGYTYPSIDHIHPLSKGGTHTWDNVRLAHCRCNTLKSNKIMNDDKEIRFRLGIC